jgi:hypothetical protein
MSCVSRFAPRMRYGASHERLPAPPSYADVSHVADELVLNGAAMSRGDEMLDMGEARIAGSAKKDVKSEGREVRVDGRESWGREACEALRLWKPY